jgi:hypothetical protein
VVAAWTGGKRNPVRAVLLAAAEDADRLDADADGRLPLSLLDRVLVTCNDRDRVLRLYPKLYGRGGPPALGATGPCGDDGSEKVEVIDVSASVGKRHDWRCYSSAPEVCDLWTRYTFLEDAAQDAP